jgi:hypothetical protein
MKKDRGELRTYTVIPGTVQVPYSTIYHNGKVQPNPSKGVKTIVQPLGRQAQQGQHVMGRYMWERAHREPNTLWKPTIGITLTCRDSAELQHVTFLLLKKKIVAKLFFDENPDYGLGVTIATAMCTEPVYRDQVVDILDYLPLWPGEQG